MDDGTHSEIHMLTTQLFKIVYMKQFNLRGEEADMIGLSLSVQAGRLEFKVHKRTELIVHPFWGVGPREDEILGI